MAVLVVDPQAARPDSLSTMLGQLGLLERCSILIVITVVLAMVVVAPSASLRPRAVAGAGGGFRSLLTPCHPAAVFVSLRWDATVDWDWTAVFAPLWAWEAILLLCCACCTQDKFFGPEPDDEGLKRELQGTRVGAMCGRRRPRYCPLHPLRRLTSSCARCLRLTASSSTRSCPSPSSKPSSPPG